MPWPLYWFWRYFQSRLVRLVNYFGGPIKYMLLKLFLLIANFASISFFALLTAAIIQWFFRSNFVEYEKLLDFNFKTCASELAGVCSFPEAEILVGPDEVELQPGYYYTFALDLVLFDTPQNRQLSLVMANINLKDESLKMIKSFHKSIPIFRAFSSRSIFYRLYVLTRNLCFWPLFLIGFFAEDISDTYSVKFPSYFLEKIDRPTRLITVQLQNRFIQLSSGSLKIRTSLSFWSFLLNEYPLTSFVLLFLASFFTYASVSIIYCIIRELSNRIRH